MQSVRIYCKRCQKDDTAAVIGEINKLCAEFGIRHGIARLSSIATDLIKGRKVDKLRNEEKEVAKHVALRMLTMMHDNHYCEYCSEKVSGRTMKDALRKQFKLIPGGKD